MQSLPFVFQATLLAPLVEFATSSSGHVEPRQGLALGWLGSVVAGLAVVFGTADQAQADDCRGVPDGKSGWACSNVMCDSDHNGDALAMWDIYYNHSTRSGCGESGIRSCTCPP